MCNLPPIYLNFLATNSISITKAGSRVYPSNPSHFIACLLLPLQQNPANYSKVVFATWWAAHNRSSAARIVSIPLSCVYIGPDAANGH